MLESDKKSFHHSVKKVLYFMFCIFADEPAWLLPGESGVRALVCRLPDQGLSPIRSFIFYWKENVTGVV